MKMMRIVLLISLLVTAIVFSKTAEAQDKFELIERYLPEWEYVALRSNELAPFADHVYIGVGQSLSPLIALLQARGVKAYNLPLSSFRFDIDGWPDMDNQLLIDYIFPHLDHFLPRPEVLNGRDIVVVDFAKTGATLFSARQAVSRYYKQEKFREQMSAEVQVKAVAVVSKTSKLPKLADGSEILKITFDPQEPFLDAIEERKLFKQYAQYGEFDVWDEDSNSELLKSNERAIYAELVEYFRGVFEDQRLSALNYVISACRKLRFAGGL